MTRRKGSQDYPEWMKREVIKLYTEEGQSVSEIREQYPIRERKRVSAWTSQYRIEGEAMFANKRNRSGRKPKKENETAYIARLEMAWDVFK